MQFPSKVTKYENSSVPVIVKILSIIEDSDISPLELYKKVKRNTNAYDFLLILDSLYALNKIVLKEESGLLHYVKTN